ncbi:MAG: acyl-CoA thioesterase [Lachnospiraceae bacterium]|nr:acyl-CoA thioesterase [Lachnospiraceae bacterium]
MKEYIHTVQYYETDKMGITHHSNYTRWMEEARIAFLSALGYEYDRLEEMGIVSPVLKLSCDYRKTTTFPDRISIRVSVEEFRGVKLFLAYEMRNEAGEIVCTASSSHAFLGRDGRPVRMKQDYPDLYDALTRAASQAAEREGSPA